MVTFSVGKYRDKVLCHVVSMHVGYLLLGSPWQYDRRVQHDGFQNRYSFLMEGRVITLAQLSPREAHEDQLKIKRARERESERGKSSGDGSPKERPKRIAYCANHVTFQRKFEQKISKPFHNDRAKIRGRILFKRKGMMRSKVLNKVRSHGKSWEESRSSYMLAETQKWPTRKIWSIATN